MFHGWSSQAIEGDSCFLFNTRSEFELQRQLPVARVGARPGRHAEVRARRARVRLPEVRTVPQVIDLRPDLQDRVAPQLEVFVRREIPGGPAVGASLADSQR